MRCCFRSLVALPALLRMACLGMILLLIATCGAGTLEPDDEHALSLVISDGVAYFATNDGHHLAVDLTTE